MKKNHNSKLKRIMVPLLNTIITFSCAITILVEATKTKLRLIGNWLARVDLSDRIVTYGDDPALKEDWSNLMSDFEAIKEESFYARALAESNFIVALLIIAIEVAIIAGLVWLARQNLKRLIWVSSKKNPRTLG